jgi:hypothetical protein
MRRCYLTTAMSLLLATLPACRNDKAATTVTTAAAHVPGTPHTDEVLNAWRNAGLSPESFAPVQPAPNGAAYCEHGLVRGVDTTLCEYANDDALKRGTQQVREGWARADVHTGVVLSAKRTTMVAIDRERREPSGKTIGQMAKVFSRL